MASPRTRRGNRIGLTIVGITLTLIGLATLARSLGLLPALLGNPDSTLIDSRTRQLTTANTWFWPALAVTLTATGLLTLRWLAVQTRVNTIRALRLEPDPRRGVTTLPAKAATGALQEDLAESPDLQRAHAILRGSPTRPQLHLHITLQPAADVTIAMHRIHQAVDRYRTATEHNHLTTTVHIRTAR